MKKVEEMTLEEIRDEIALRDWRRTRDSHGGPAWRHKDAPDDPHSTWGHPIPATLDTVAGLMPEGWWWEVSMSNWWTDTSGKDNHLNKIMYEAHATTAAKRYEDQTDFTLVATEPADTELLARFRLLLLILRKG